MGKYDSNIALARESLARAERELGEAVRAMADAAPEVREAVLGQRRQRVQEFQEQIETFTWANNR